MYYCFSSWLKDSRGYFLCHIEIYLQGIKCFINVETKIHHFLFLSLFTAWERMLLGRSVVILQEGHLKLLQCDKTTHFVLFGLRSGWQLVFGGKHDIFRNSDKKACKGKINHAFNTVFMISYSLPPMSYSQPLNFICSEIFRDVLADLLSDIYHYHLSSSISRHVRHLWFSFLAKIVNNFSHLLFLKKRYIAHVWKRAKYNSTTLKQLLWTCFW